MDTPIRTDGGKLLGFIRRCEHGSQFIQAKHDRVPGACENYGPMHECVDPAMQALMQARAAYDRVHMQMMLTPQPCDYCGSTAVERGDGGLLLGCVDCGYERRS